MERPLWSVEKNIIRLSFIYFLQSCKRPHNFLMFFPVYDWCVIVTFPLDYRCLELDFLINLLVKLSFASQSYPLYGCPCVRNLYLWALKFLADYGRVIFPERVRAGMALKTPRPPSEFGPIPLSEGQ